MVNLTQLLLAEAFGDDQKKKWLTSNPELNDDTIDDYIKRFDRIRKIKPQAALVLNIDGLPDGQDRFDISKYKDWHSFESFVDGVGTEVPLRPTTTIEFDGKPLFEKNGLEVYYGDTPKACISYKGNIPYSWCVAAKSSNMFYTYRTNERLPSFYFVKDVEATKKELETWNGNSRGFKDKWHFMVIQVNSNTKIDDPNESNYIVTSANNDGDKPMSWNEIIKVQPKLRGSQSEFIPKPLERQLADKIKSMRYGVKYDYFSKLSYEDKSLFIDITDSPVNDKIFLALSTELKNKYINRGFDLSQLQLDSIKSDKNLYKRYVEMSLREFDEWFNSTLKSENPHFNMNGSRLNLLIDTKIFDKYIDRLSDKQLSTISKHGGIQFVNYINQHNKTFNLTQSAIDQLLSNDDFSLETIEWFIKRKINIAKLLTKRFSFIYQNSVETAGKVYDYLMKNKISQSEIFTSDKVFSILSNDPIETGFNFLSERKINWKSINFNFLRFYDKKKEIKKFLLEKNILISDDSFSKLLDTHQNNKRKLQQVINAFIKSNIVFTSRQVSELLEYSIEPGKTVLALIKSGIVLSERSVEDFLYETRHDPELQPIIEKIIEKIKTPIPQKIVNLLCKYTFEIEKTVASLRAKKIVPSKIFNNETLNYMKSRSGLDKVLNMLSSNKITISRAIIAYLTYEKNSSLYRNTNQDDLYKILNRSDLKFSNDAAWVSFTRGDDKEKVLSILKQKGFPALKILNSFGTVVTLISGIPENKQFEILDLYKKYNVPFTDDILLAFIGENNSWGREYGVRANPKICVEILKLAGPYKNDVLAKIKNQNIVIDDSDLMSLKSNNYINDDDIAFLKKPRTNESIFTYKDFYSFLF